LAGALVRTILAPPDLVEADAEAQPAARSRVALAAEWACVVVTCGTSAALFLGGWQIPGVTLGQQHAELRLELVGSAVFLAKAGALVGLTAALRRALPVVRLGQATRLCWRWLVPLAAVGLAATVAGLAWPLGRGVERALAAGTCAVAALLL